ncbi:MAG: M14 family zinc carboxypeptidase [Flavobacteriales bacterium]|nr:M14 family zinc carboxypeptidase [Flavobacteriales bacterium]
MHKFLLIVVCLLYVRVDAQHNSLPYEHTKLIRLESFSPEISEALEPYEVTYLSCRSHSSFPELIVKDEVLNWLNLNQIPYTLLEKDLKRKIDREHQHMLEIGKQRDGASWYHTYRTYEEVQDKLSEIALESSIATLIDLGLSYENRALTGIKLSTGGTDKPAIFINGCQHAREWITVMASTFLVDHLVHNYNTDLFIQNLLAHVDVYIVPIVNPDGYVYTHTTDRYWRKNRQLNPASSCVGTDLNRNWDADWNGWESTSTSACSDLYVGEEAFSAVEAQNVKNYMESIPNLKGHLDIHSYSALVLGPWGYTNQITPDHEEVVRLGTAMNEALSNAYEYSYTFGTGDADGALYLASGTMPDWSYDSLGAFGFTYELRPKTWDEGGFELPESKIKVACEENYQGVLEMLVWAAEDVMGCTNPQALNFDAHASLDDGSCELNVSLDSQWIVFPQGWRIFSTYIQPIQAQLDLVLAPISTNIIIVKNAVGAAYLPEYNYNGIGDLIDGQGYQLKLKTSDTLTISGMKIPHENFEMVLNEGWNMMAYLCDSVSDVVTAFHLINDQIHIVKSSDGSVYLPDFNYNGLGELKPGEGYQIKMRSTISFAYPFP